MRKSLVILTNTPVCGNNKLAFKCIVAPLLVYRTA